MRGIVIFYSLAMAVLVFLLKFLEYRYFIRDLSLEFYLVVVAVLFTALGIWVGLKLTSKRKILITPNSSDDFVVSEEMLNSLAISKREHEVLTLMAEGLSNQEIADKLFVSLSTIKTHSANIFSKLEVRRRTQAVQHARELRLIR
jgi:NarL family two-component system response regulator LiaR